MTDDTVVGTKESRMESHLNWSKLRDFERTSLRISDGILRGLDDNATVCVNDRIFDDETLRKLEWIEPVLCSGILLVDSDRAWDD